MQESINWRVANLWTRASRFFRVSPCCPHFGGFFFAFIAGDRNMVSKNRKLLHSNVLTVQLFRFTLQALYSQTGLGQRLSVLWDKICAVKKNSITSFWLNEMRTRKIAVCVEHSREVPWPAENHFWCVLRDVLPTAPQLSREKKNDFLVLVSLQLSCLWSKWMKMQYHVVLLCMWGKSCAVSLKKSLISTKLVCVWWYHRLSAVTQRVTCLD